MESESTLKAGTVLNNGEWRYRIEKVLGQGGFGITYLAIGYVKVGQVTTEAKFAIKEHFPPSFCTRVGESVVAIDGKTTDYERSKGDFISEAKKLHALGSENDNIVKVNEVFEENQTAYYVMQYINGISLTKYVKDKGKLTYDETLRMMLPIMNAVDFLHKSRINHLDIKPDNIMLHDSMDGKAPILIDFGLSVHFKKNGDKTSPKGVMGVSEGYSPLEQYAGIKEFNPATDIYAIAATMLYALTGVPPKGASDLKQSEVRSMLSKLAPQQAVDALCKALDKSYEDRTPSVSAFKADLGLAGNGGSDTVVIVPGDNKRRKFIIAISAVVAVVVIALCVCLTHKPEPETEPKPEPQQTESSSQTQGSMMQNETTEGGNQGNASDVTPAKPEMTDPGQNSTDGNNAASQNQATQSQYNNTSVNNPVAQSPRPVVTTGTLELGYATWRGGIRNGKPDGKGRMMFFSTHAVDRRSSVEAHNGDYFDATYDNGSLISGKLYDSNGNLIKTIIP